MGMTKEQAKARAIELMEEVGITNAAQRYSNYPFQFSGGMRQRIVIAFIILIVIMLMSMVGPHIRNYDLVSNQESRKWTDRLKEMPPRISGLEWLGFNGHKTLEGFPQRFDILLNDENAEGIIIGNFSKPNAVGMVKVKVDYYKYVDYMNSYDSYLSLSIKEYETIKAYEASNPGEVIIHEDGELIINGTYLSEFISLNS